MQMGKTPGKWIKVLLFGKKASKSNLSTGDVLRSTNDKALVSTSKPDSGTGAGKGVESIGTASRLASDRVILPSAKREGDAQTISNLGLLNDLQSIRHEEADLQSIRHEEAAIKAQAAFRGYLARRAFRALRGIIRLQALIRGHLVRRQSVATLRCVVGIIKFQALVRGQKVRRSSIGIKVREKQSLEQHLDAKHPYSFEIISAWGENRSKNAFVHKLLPSSPTAIPLRLQYGPEEPNSVWEWVKRWTMSRFWELQSQQKNITHSKSLSKQGSFQRVSTEQGRPKFGVQKLPTENVESGPDFTSEPEKLRRNVRKVLSHPVEFVHGPQQNEIEKVKRNLRRISDSTMETSDRVERGNEKSKRAQRKPLSSFPTEVSEKGIKDSAEKVMEDMALAESKLLDLETSIEFPAVVEPVDDLHNHPAVDLQPKKSNTKNMDISGTDEGFSSKDDQISDEKQKTSRRRVSLPAKQDYQENGLHNKPRVPSYMAATESAKAKLRAQGSPNLDLDAAEKNGLPRRHSLPSPINGKSSSLSPRARTLVQATVKGGIKNEKSPLSSRDGNDKVIQAGWRR